MASHKSIYEDCVPTVTSRGFVTSKPQRGSSLASMLRRSILRRVVPIVRTGGPRPFSTRIGLPPKHSMRLNAFSSFPKCSRSFVTERQIVEQTPPFSWRRFAITAVRTFFNSNEPRYLIQIEHLGWCSWCGHRFRCSLEQRDSRFPVPR